MRTLDNEFVDNAALANGPRDELNLGIWRHLGNEPLSVKGTNFLPPNATSHNRHVIQIRRCAHGREGGVRATLDELRAHVPFPGLDHGLLLGCEIFSHGQGLLALRRVSGRYQLEEFWSYRDLAGEWPAISRDQQDGKCNPRREQHQGNAAGGPVVAVHHGNAIAGHS